MRLCLYAFVSNKSKSGQYDVELFILVHFSCFEGAAGKPLF